MPPEPAPDDDDEVESGVCDVAVELALAGQEGGRCLPHIDRCEALAD